MNDLKKRLVDMAEVVQQMIKFSVDMIVKRDINLSKEVFNREREANLTEIVTIVSNVITVDNGFFFVVNSGYCLIKGRNNAFDCNSVIKADRS